MPFSRSPFSGFPFDRSSNRDENLQSTLDDIAKRHPELAEHLDTFTHHRPSSRASRLADEPEFDDRFERPFREAFTAGFPFAGRERLDPEEFFYRPPRDSHGPQGASPPEGREERERKGDAVPEAKHEERDGRPPEEETSSKPRSSTIQQSNTIDLGQKQEAVDERNQRSMSAPPAHKGQRYTSSIHIPVNQQQQEQPQQQPTEMADNHQHRQESRPVERIIPIQIEGRDGPVTPRKNSGSGSASSAFTQSPRVDRIFGQRPEQFTQYLNRDPRQFSDPWRGFPAEEAAWKQTAPAQAHAAPRPHSPAARPAENQQEAPKASAGPPPPPPAPQPEECKPPTAIEQIQMIQKDVSALMEQAQQFAGKPRDKQYLYLDEMLTRNLIKLDNIDTQGQDIIRSSRKEAIKCIEKAIGILETKAALNQEQAEGKPAEEAAKDGSVAAETTEGEREASAEKMEVESKEENSGENLPTSTDFVLVEKEKEAQPVEEGETTMQSVDDKEGKVGEEVAGGSEGKNGENKNEGKTD